jgi:hypothetical protein
MELSGQLYVLAALYAGRESLISFEWEAGWAPEPDGAVVERKIPSPSGN